MIRKLSLLTAAAAASATLLSAPLAGAEEVESTSGITFYRSYQQEFADVFRCSTSPQRWWCG